MKRLSYSLLLLTLSFYIFLSLFNQFDLCPAWCTCLRLPRARPAPTNPDSWGLVTSLTRTTRPCRGGASIISPLPRRSEAVRAPRGPAASCNQRQRPGRPLATLVGAGRGAPCCPRTDRRNNARVPTETHPAFPTTDSSGKRAPQSFRTTRISSSVK